MDSSHPGQTNDTDVSGSSDIAPSDNATSTADTTATPDDSTGAATGDDTVGTATIDVNSRDGQSGSVLANVSNDQCQNGCKAFANDLSLLEYCQQVCGLTPIKSVTSADCTKKEEIRKDYCYRVLAVTKKDLSACDKIKDANIKKTCTTRVTQDIIENH